MVRTRFQTSISVFVIVLDGPRVLLLRRANTGWHDGAYSLPAGAVDGGETLDKAAARELREETGIVAVPSDLHLAHLLHCRTGDDGGEWLGAFFIATRWSGEPALLEPQKHDALGWFDVEDLPESTIAYVKQGVRSSIGQVAFSTFGWSR
jgi:8-oxo-dGTP diphosphatase